MTLPFKRPLTDPNPVTRRSSGGRCTVVVFDFSWLPSASVRTKSDRTTKVANRLRCHMARKARAAGSPRVVPAGVPMANAATMPPASTARATTTGHDARPCSTSGK
jgi:hypothetical protein